MTMSFERPAVYSHSYFGSIMARIVQCLPIQGTRVAPPPAGGFGIAVYSVASNPFRRRICAEGELPQPFVCTDESQIGRYFRVVWANDEEADEPEKTYRWCIIDFGFDDSIREFSSLESLLEVEVTPQYLLERNDVTLNLANNSACSGFPFSTVKILDDNDPRAKAGAASELCYAINQKFVPGL
eukprot:CAMPEP_0198707612 /NCGR_PEP_ID=MMETSP1471-20131121/409_1 /TAXON_ID=41880 /ORGANISM="Pycnococcus provasolii, Strain RCC733" /LENGTH=183 /DNA_ID=CAMNT_0044466673 /DNA_START=274 /DNA_END=825 /DNA_ORIENTATION=+